MKLTLIRSTKPCEKCGVEIPLKVTYCGKCLIENLRENLPSDADGKLVLNFPDRPTPTKEAA